MKRVITVQHCQAVHHVNNMVGGVTDWELTALGLEQARHIGIALREKIGTSSNYKLYSSDLTRTRQTAEMIAEHLKLTPIYRQELREISMGSATGQSQEWFKINQIPRPNDLPWIYHKMMPDAESAVEVYARVSKVADELEKSTDNDFIIVGHGGSLSLFTARWLNLPISILEKTALLGSAGGVSFMSERDDNARVLNVWNDTSYMLQKP
jgi:broad specificity phosphatase PhoE